MKGNGNRGKISIFMNKTKTIFLGKENCPQNCKKRNNYNIIFLTLRLKYVAVNKNMKSMKHYSKNIGNRSKIFRLFKMFVML